MNNIHILQEMKAGALMLPRKAFCVFGKVVA